MKHGIEKRLKDRIPEIQEVNQLKSTIAAPMLSSSEVEKVLDGVRPFLSIADAGIEVAGIESGILQPVIKLKLINAMIGSNAIKTVIIQRMQRHFGGAPLLIEWV